MSAISLIPSALTMTSREIAGLTEKEHKHVLRDCQIMFDQLEIPLAGYTQNWTHPQNGLTYIEYVLNKDLALCLVAGYSAPLRLKIIKRLEELENKTQEPKHILPQSFAEALQLAANQAAELEAARPAIEFVEKYVESTGNMGFRQVCKLLRIKENVFREFLLSKKIMYRLGSVWMPYAAHIDAGRFYVTTGISHIDHSFNNAKFTPKGVEWIAKLWSEK